MPSRSLTLYAAGLSLGVSGLLASTIQATEPTPPSIRPVTVASVMILQEAEGISSETTKVDLPASITAPSGILPLATDGAFVFEPLDRRDLCPQRASVRCAGPDYRSCLPRIYYGTDPCDDDPVLSMSPTVRDPKTRHWYEKALNMVLRKTAIAEALNQETSKPRAKPRRIAKIRMNFACPL